MAKVTSREGLKLWALRRLGHPTIKINVDNDQLEDRIDEALEFFQEYHFDGIERVYLQHQITATDKANKTIPVSDAVTGVIRVFPIGASDISRGNMFSAKYQFHLQNVFDTTNQSLIYYDQVRSHVALLDFMFTTTPQTEFNRHKNEIQMTYNWDSLNVGEYIIIECYRILDPATYPDIYNDRFLKRYVYALFKLQWGNNLKKYTGMQLPGGVSFDGEAIYSEAQEEISKIEEEVQDMFSGPPEFFVG